MLTVCGCRKPAQETPAQQNSPAPASMPAAQKDQPTDNLSDAAARILNKAHRPGGVVLRGECRPHGVAEKYLLPRPVTLEPMDKALAEISAKYQNIYWRESPASGVRVGDSAAKAGLLRVRIHEFRIVEDREPDGVMAVLWRAPEVRAFLRRKHVRLAMRPESARKTISPPMIVQMKNAMVAEILDRIAAGYRADPPKVWIYQECSENKDTLIDVQMR